MSQSITFQKESPLFTEYKSEKYNRNKGWWIYCLHPKWKQSNDAKREAVDVCMTMIMKKLKEEEVYNVVQIWGTDDSEIYDEFQEQNYKGIYFITVFNSEIQSKTDCLSKEELEDHFVGIVKKIKSSFNKLSTQEKNNLSKTTIENDLGVSSKKKTFGFF